MSLAGSTFARHYVIVACPCGRSLRARLESAGSEICCWDCHRSVPVPVPRASLEEAFRALGLGWSESLCAPPFGLVLLAAAAVTGLLCVPQAGVPLATGALVLAAVGYVEMLARGNPLDPEYREAERPGIRRCLASGSAALLVGIAMGLPYWISPGGPGHAARIRGLAWLPMLVGGTLLPLVLAALFVRDGSRRLGARRVLAAVRRHPAVACLVLATVPLAALFAEGLLLVLSLYCDALRFHMSELFPETSSFVNRFRLPQNFLFAPGASLDGRVLSMYACRLGEGYSLLGAIPPSLSLRPDHPPTYWSVAVPENAYFVIRVALTFIGVAVVLQALSAQARCLALLATLDMRRIPARTKPEIGPAIILATS